MKTKDAYVLFERLLDEEKVYLDSSLSFDKLCQLIGIDPDSLNKLLLDEHGLNGEEILNIYRDSEHRRLNRIIDSFYTTEPRSS